MDESIKLPRTAISWNDKLKILQARDKYVRSHRRRQTDIETANIVIGNCEDMCPELERYCRLDRNLVSVFECNDFGLADEHKMVKEYVRSGADQDEPLPYELRPANVLERTMLYLATNIIDLIDSEDEEIKVGEYYDFLWNRLRAIKKDITQQDLKTLSSVLMLERCARFHIYSAHRFIEEEIGVFDTKMNNENLVKTMQSLKDLYDDLRLHNGVECPNEAEFRCYDILLNLCNNDVLRHISKLKPSVRNSESVKFALQVHQALSTNNFVKFFYLMKETSLLNACVMHRYFGLMRLTAFQLLRRSFKSGNKEELLPKCYIFDLLCFDQDEEFDEFCEQISIEIDENDNVILKRDFNQQVYLSTGYTSRRSLEYIDAKRGRKRLSEIIYHETMAENPYGIYPLENSFDANGQLSEVDIRLDNEIINVTQKKVYSFAEAKNKTTESTISTITAPTTNKFAIKFEPTKSSSSSVNFGPGKGLFSQPTNMLQKPSVFASNQPKSSESNLFGKKPTLFGSTPGQQSNNLFGSSTSQNLFGKDGNAPNNNLFTSQMTSTDLFGKSINKETKSTGDGSFHFKMPSNSPSSTNNLFSTNTEQTNKSQDFTFKLPDRQQSVEVSSRVTKEPAPEPLQVASAKESTKLSDEELSSLSGNVLASLLNELLPEIIRESIINVYISTESIELTNSILDEVFTETVRDLCKSVYNHEKNKRQELKQMIDLTSRTICDQFIGEVLNESVNLICKTIYLQELDAFIDTKSRLFADSYFEETFEQIVYEVCRTVYQNEYRENQRIVSYIRQKRGWRLARKYFQHWKKRCDYLKRYRFYKDNFPASRMECSVPVLKRILSVPEINTYEQPFKRKLIESNNNTQSIPYSFNSSANSNQSLSCVDLAKESQIKSKLEELKEQMKKFEKNNELSTKSKLEYAKRTLNNLKKVSFTFNKSLEYLRPFINSDLKK